jgi:hypothetical protein
MKLYIYDLEEMVVRATVERETKEACEDVAFVRFGSDEYGFTYSPALDMDDGLIDNADAPRL